MPFKSRKNHDRMPWSVALGIAWLLLCGGLGAALIEGSLRRHPLLIGPLLPLLIGAWVALFFLGQAAVAGIVALAREHLRRPRAAVLLPVPKEEGRCPVPVFAREDVALEGPSWPRQLGIAFAIDRLRRDSFRRAAEEVLPCSANPASHLVAALKGYKGPEASQLKWTGVGLGGPASDLPDSALLKEPGMGFPLPASKSYGELPGWLRQVVAV